MKYNDTFVYSLEWYVGAWFYLVSSYDIFGGE